MIGRAASIAFDHLNLALHSSESFKQDFEGDRSTFDGKSRTNSIDDLSTDVMTSLHNDRIQDMLM